MTAVTGDKSAWDDSTLGNGVFTYYFVEGLEGAADANSNYDVTVMEAFSYAEPLVTTYEPDQHPQAFNNYPNELSLVVLYRPPIMPGISPDSVHQGNTLEVVISGTDLIGATVVSFGSGITVNSFTIDSANQITASISVAPDAATGLRDISVTTPGGTTTTEESFTVESPQISYWIWVGIGSGSIAVGLVLYMLWRRRANVR